MAQLLRQKLRREGLASSYETDNHRFENDFREETEPIDRRQKGSKHSHPFSRELIMRDKKNP